MWHIRCQICQRVEAHRIPDQAYILYEDLEREHLEAQWIKVNGHQELAKVIVKERELKPIEGYVHNPGNPALGVCERCSGRPFTFALNGQLPPQPELPQESPPPVSGIWGEYLKVAERFRHKVPFEDRDDIAQEIVLRLAQVACKGELTQAGMYRVASYVVLAYWRDRERHPFQSLYQEIKDGDGNTLELWETIASDEALDLDAWLDAKTWLRGCPRRLIDIAYKKEKGQALNNADLLYLSRYRRQLPLVL